MFADTYENRIEGYQVRVHIDLIDRTPLARRASSQMQRSKNRCKNETALLLVEAHAITKMKFWRNRKHNKKIVGRENVEQTMNCALGEQTQRKRRKKYFNSQTTSSIAWFLICILNSKISARSRQENRISFDACKIYSQQKKEEETHNVSPAELKIVSILELITWRVNFYYCIICFSFSSFSFGWFSWLSNSVLVAAYFRNR